MAQIISKLAQPDGCSPGAWPERRDWDAIVVGAGPAGALAALGLAHAGAGVLLVDKARFPRYKVCGCCLNQAALAELRSAGLENLAGDLRAVPLRRFDFFTPSARAGLDLPLGVSLSRTSFDTALVDAAVHAGAAFSAPICASVGAADRDGIDVALNHGHDRAIMRARVVLVADGLAGQALATRPEFLARVEPGSRIGAGCVVPDDTNSYPAGTIFMACGRGGYVGLVRLEEESPQRSAKNQPLNIAAAFDVASVRAAGGPGKLAASLLRDVGLPIPQGLDQTPWRGTPALTRRRPKAAAERVFVLGDAAAYVEPFTGEGMAWALHSAVGVTSLAVKAIENWQPSLARTWEIAQRQLQRRQRACRALTLMLRYPALASLGARGLTYLPWLAPMFVRAVAGDTPAEIFNEPELQER